MDIFDILDIDSFEVLNYPFENYLISKNGNYIVNSYTRKILCEYKNIKTGYKIVSLYNSDKDAYRTICTHSIIGKHFLQNPLNLKLIDHKDGNKHNNNIENLRYCTRSQNQMNRRCNCNSNTQLKGIYHLKKCNRWKAVITLNGKIIYLGLFKNVKEAIEVRKNASHKLFGVFSNE